jgi:DNA invertase Pin-like site-specific DNA recombinase
LFEAINGKLLDMLAAVARKDYVDQRRRQAQGQAEAKEGRCKGRPEDAERNDGVARILTAGQTWGPIQSRRAFAGYEQRRPCVRGCAVLRIEAA